MVWKTRNLLTDRHTFPPLLKLLPALTQTASSRFGRLQSVLQLKISLFRLICVVQVLNWGPGLRTYSLQQSPWNASPLWGDMHCGKARCSVWGGDAHTFNITTSIKKKWVGFKVLPTPHFMREELESLCFQPHLEGRHDYRFLVVPFPPWLVAFFIGSFESRPISCQWYLPTKHLHLAPFSPLTSCRHRILVKLIFACNNRRFEFPPTRYLVQPILEWRRRFLWYSCQYSFKHGWHFYFLCNYLIYWRVERGKEREGWRDEK